MEAAVLSHPSCISAEKYYNTVAEHRSLLEAIFACSLYDERVYKELEGTSYSEVTDYYRIRWSMGRKCMLSTGLQSVGETDSRVLSHNINSPDIICVDMVAQWYVRCLSCGGSLVRKPL